MKRIHVYYSGRVQGVGFRFIAQRIAQNIGIAGWVKNLPDGRVELVGEGEEVQLKKLTLEIDEYLKDYISDTEVNWMEATGEHKDFGVRF